MFIFNEGRYLKYYSKFYSIIATFYLIRSIALITIKKFLKNFFPYIDEGNFMVQFDLTEKLLNGDQKFIQGTNIYLSL